MRGAMGEAIGNRKIGNRNRGDYFRRGGDGEIEYDGEEECFG
jgi:hypothetical protein